MSLCESNAIDHVESISKNSPTYTANAIINQPTKTDQQPNHRQNIHNRNNPSEGKPTPSSTNPQRQNSAQITPKIPNNPYNIPYIQKVRSFKVESGWRIHNLSTGYQSEVYFRTRTFINKPSRRIQHRTSTFSWGYGCNPRRNPMK